MGERISESEFLDFAVVPVGGHDVHIFTNEKRITRNRTDRTYPVAGRTGKKQFLKTQKKKKMRESHGAVVVDITGGKRGKCSCCRDPRGPYGLSGGDEGNI